MQANKNSIVLTDPSAAYGAARRVALDACVPFGLQARPYGPPVGSVFAARLTVFGVRAFQSWNALERFKLKML